MLIVSNLTARWYVNKLHPSSFVLNTPHSGLEIEKIVPFKSNISLIKEWQRLCIICLFKHLRNAKMSPVRCHHPESLPVPNADFGRRISISKQESK